MMNRIEIILCTVIGSRTDDGVRTVYCRVSCTDYSKMINPVCAVPVRGGRLAGVHGVETEIDRSAEFDARTQAWVSASVRRLNALYTRFTPSLPCI